MEVYYVNTNNTRIDLLSAPYFISATDFFNYEWSYDDENRKIKKFYRDVTEKAVEMDVIADTYDEYCSALNNLLDVFEVDIVKNQKGKLYFNDFYLECNIFKSEKELDSYVVPRGKIELGIACDKTKWIKEETYSFYMSNTDAQELAENKIYNYQYPYRYGAAEGQGSVRNNGVIENDILIRIYGPATNPLVTIGGNIYQVYTTLENNERLEINTLNQTCYKISTYGDKTNCFNDRDKSRQLYLKLQAGASTVVWNNSFNFDIVVFNARSEPSWENML